MIRAVIFDFNNVIADDETPHLRCFKQALAEHGLSLTKDDYYGTYLGLAGSGKTLWARRNLLVCTSGTTGAHHAGCSKRPSSKAAASEEARRTLRYVEPLSAARTPLADFFSILLDERTRAAMLLAARDGTCDRDLPRAIMN